jgi:hypothetical protein
VIDVPISTCIGCGKEAEGHVTHAYGNDDGTASVDVDPPTGWVALEPRSRLPDGVRRRLFDICAACYSAGAADGSRTARATFEAVPA